MLPLSQFMFHADVNNPQLLRVIVLMSAAAAVLGKTGCQLCPGATSPPAAADLQSCVERLAALVARTASTILNMVVEDALGPASLQPHNLQAPPRQAAGAVSLLLLLFKQLSVSSDDAFKL